MPRRLTTIVVTDIVGYSRLMAADESGTLATVKAHQQQIINPLIASCGGRVVKLMGDGSILEFASVVDSVRFAVLMQRAIAEDSQTLAYRIGINIGDVIADGDDLFGEGVNIAARLEPLADHGGICISHSAYSQMLGKLDLDFEAMGAQAVKNIPEPIEVWRVVMNEKVAMIERPIPDPDLLEKVTIVTSRRSLWLWLLYSSVALLILVIGFAGWWQSESVPASQLMPDKPSIAVLPFKNLSADPAEEYFADGMTDDLITDLSKISGLFVIARNTVFLYKDQAVDIRDIAQNLRVRYVLEGSVRRADNNVRINAQLIDGSTGNHLWAERYDRQYADIFALQNEVIEQITEALSIELNEVEHTEIARLPTESLEAYDYYLRGEELAYQADSSSAIDALELFEKSIALDPNFADAYAGYARVAADVLAYSFANTLPSAVARKRAYEAAGRALTLNPRLSRGYSVLALLQMLDGKHKEAGASAHKAVTLSSNSAEAYLNLAVVRVFAGASTEALTAMETVLKLDPNPPSYVHDYHGLVLYMNQRYSEAISVLEKVENAEKSDFGLETLAAAYARTGQKDKARAAIETLLERWPSHSLASVRIAYAHHAREEDLVHRVDALRIAGLPEWPYGIQGDPALKLNGTEIDALTFEHTWIGERAGFGPFMQYVGANGDFVERGPNYRISGTASRKGDTLCLEVPGILLGRQHCGPIYRNPDGTPEKLDEFIYLNAYLAKRFTMRP